MNVEADVGVRAAIHRALGEPHRLAIVDALLLSDRTPTDLTLVTGLDANHLAFHLGVLEGAGVVERGPGHGDGRRRYVRLRRQALSGLAPTARLAAEHVLFVCTRNSARSQLAAALWKRRTGGRADSAGHEPAAEVHPFAIEVARRHGLDLSGCRPRGYGAIAGSPDVVVSVCDRALEAGLPFEVPRLHWSVPDPAVGGLDDFEAAYRELADRVDVLAASRPEEAAAERIVPQVGVGEIPAPRRSAPAPEGS